jgi:hypothetical protein
MASDRRPLPLPSHIHYELLLQLLERQSAQEIGRQQPQKEQLQTLISTLRKAFSQQKHLEESCRRQQIPIEYYWSLNETLDQPKDQRKDQLNSDASKPSAAPPESPAEPSDLIRVALSPQDIS